jgi:hypothetical protein
MSLSSFLFGLTISLVPTVIYVMVGVMIKEAQNEFFNRGKLYKDFPLAFLTMIFVSCIAVMILLCVNIPTKEQNNAEYYLEKD